jgi:hypothetical protein
MADHEPVNPRRRTGRGAAAGAHESKKRPEDGRSSNEHHIEASRFASERRLTAEASGATGSVRSTR